MPDFSDQTYPSMQRDSCISCIYNRCSIHMGYDNPPVSKPRTPSRVYRVDNSCSPVDSGKNTGQKVYPDVYQASGNSYYQHHSALRRSPRESEKLLDEPDLRASIQTLNQRINTIDS
jgi:hypothetical protein